MPRGEDWADRRDAQPADDAWEPTYPDGSVRHECWNSDLLHTGITAGNRRTPASGPVIRHDPEDGEDP